MKMTALKSVRYGKTRYEKGDTFEVADKWARVLRVIGRAKPSEGGDEFGIEKQKKARPAFKTYTPPEIVTKPAAPVTAAKQAPKRAVITTGKKEDDAARAYKTRDMGVQPPSAPAAEPLKVDDIESQEVVKPHEKPAE